MYLILQVFCLYFIFLTDYFGPKEKKLIKAILFSRNCNFDKKDYSIVHLRFDASSIEKKKRRFFIRDFVAVSLFFFTPFFHEQENRQQCRNQRTKTERRCLLVFCAFQWNADSKIHSLSCKCVSRFRESNARLILPVSDYCRAVSLPQMCSTI